MWDLILIAIGVVIGWFTAQFEFSQKAKAKIKELWASLKAKLSSSSTPEPPAPTE